MGERGSSDFGCMDGSLPKWLDDEVADEVATAAHASVLTITLPGETSSTPPVPGSSLLCLRLRGPREGTLLQALQWR